MWPSQVTDRFVQPQMPRLKKITEPTVFPVSVADLRAHCKIDFTDDDGYLTDLIAWATAAVEDETRRQIMPATWEAVLDGFPASTVTWGDGGSTGFLGNRRIGDYGGVIELRIQPVISITTLTYIDTNGATQSLVQNTNYKADLISQPSRLTPLYGLYWPYTMITQNAVTVTFQAGYSDTKMIPKRIIQAITFLAGYFYKNREAEGDLQPVQAHLNRMLLNVKWEAYL